MNIQKNRIFTVTITDMSADGEGIGHLEESGTGAEGKGTGGFSLTGEERGPASAETGDVSARAGSAYGSGGYALFVKDALIGDVVRARIVRPKKGYAFARLEEILTPSPDRVTPVCPVARQCGGCQLQALSYEKQLEFKNNKVKNCLIRIGGFSPEKAAAMLEEPVGMEGPFHYRNKAQFPIGTDREGRLIAGFYAGRTHTIIEAEDCALGVRENRDILRIVLDFCGEKRSRLTMRPPGRGCCAMC